MNAAMEQQPFIPLTGDACPQHVDTLLSWGLAERPAADSTRLRLCDFS
jgi:hypothetical protein